MSAWIICGQGSLVPPEGWESLQIQAFTLQTQGLHVLQPCEGNQVFKGEQGMK